MAAVHPGDGSDSAVENNATAGAMLEDDCTAANSNLSFYPFECQFCESAYKTIAAYSAHMEEQHETRFEYQHSCGLCARRFGCNDELQLHLRLHANLQPYKCKLCDQTFRLARSLEYHLQSHGGIRYFRCQLCSGTFLQLSEIHEHLKDHQMGRAILPAVEEEEVPQDGEEEDAADDMLDVSYPEMELTTHSRDSVEEAAAAATALPPLSLSGPLAGGATYQIKSEAGHHLPHLQPPLQHHLHPHPLHAMVSIPENEAQSMEDEEAAFGKAVNIKKTFCNLCNKKMATRKSLNTHYKSVHMKNVHTCTVCRTSFLFSRLLEAHTRKRKHIIPCEFCDLRFCSNKRWSSHLERYHANPAPAQGQPSMPQSLMTYPKATPIGSGGGSNNRQPASTANVAQLASIANNSTQRQSLLKNNSASSAAGLNSTMKMPGMSLLVQQQKIDADNAIGKFPCESCGKIFLSRNYLQAHLVKRQNRNFQYQCDVCEHRFSKKIILEEHKAYHERNPKKVPKLVINKKLVNGFNVSAPAAVPARSAEVAATRDADEEMDYDRHIIRLSDTSFKCNCCHRTFKAVNHLKCHLRYTHMKKNFKCRSCNQQFPFYKLYLAHMKNSKLCERCDKRICVKFDFKIHTQKCRGTAKMRNSSNASNSNAKRSNSSKQHSKEVVEVKDDDDEEDLENNLIENGGGRFAAPQFHSSLLLSSTSNNNNNLSASHNSLDDLMDTSEYPSIPHFLMDDFAPEEYKCDQCDKVFAKATSLHMHSFIHEPNKEMKCVFCNFLFLQRSSLNRHYRCRNTLHTCQVCKESFCSHVNLKQHICTAATTDRSYLGGSSGPNAVAAVASASANEAIMIEDDYLEVDLEASAEPKQNQQPEVLSQLRKRNKSGNATATVSRLGVNSEDVSGRDESIELSDTEPDSLVCMLCSTTLNTKGELDHHIGTQHSAVTKCPVCFKGFRSPTVLQIHLVARASKKNRIECNKCSHRFNKQAEFRKHYLFHTMKANRPETSDETIYSRIASKYPGK